MESLRICAQVVLADNADNIGDSFQAADDEIKAENSQQAEKPPGVVHIRDDQLLHKPGHVLAVLFKIETVWLVLGNYGSNNRGGCQNKEQEQGQLDRGKKGPHRIFLLGHQVIIRG